MAFIATTCLWQMNAQTYTGDGNPQPIDPPVNLSSDATTSLTGNIGTNPGDYTIESVMLDITHTFDADVELTLVSPSGTTLDLSIGNGGSGDNYTNTVFEDGGANILAASAPFTGTYEPEGGTFASTFDGEPINGDWTLEVFDNFGGFDSGTLNSYAITFDQINIGNPPVIACPNDIMADTDPGECSAIVNFADAIALDVEDGSITATQTGGPASGSMFPTGDTIVEYTVTDSDGNTDVCSFTVTVTDMEAPVAVCQNLTLEVDPVTGSVSITPGDIDNGSSDNCGIVDYSLDVDTFTCADTGDNDVTLTVTDEEGNSSSCTATVTIEDNTAPDIVCVGQPATITDSASDSPDAAIPDGDPTTGITRL